jgi:signal transduction histidine kinase
MQENGVLTIEISENSKNETNHTIKISISDTGAGMSKNTLENIFKPLFSTKMFGMGLGLSIVKMIVDKHKGTISVESEEGKGTTFTIELPVV